MKLQFFERLKQHIAETPSRFALIDEEDCRGGLTFGELDHLTGQIAAYLAQHKIGREDLVLIRLPRGIRPLGAMLGVWRAGAAWVCVEDFYPEDRVAYIRRDCSCRLTLDETTWEDVLRCEPITTWAEPDLHDAALCVYTSGSTGFPKGALHEYGDLEHMMALTPVADRWSLEPEACFGLMMPLGFAAIPITLIPILAVGIPIHVIPMPAVKNPKQLRRCFDEHHITISAAPASYVRSFGSAVFGSLSHLLLGGESAAGAWFEGTTEIWNTYASSECLFLVSICPLTGSEAQPPIGRPATGLRQFVQNEQGSPVTDEAGELLIENPFFRGYIHAPEETSSVLSDGFYHTGDIAVCRGDGSYTLLGRASEMIKISGNRIDPGEIEVRVCEALGLTQCVVRGIEHNGRTLLCVYYAEEVRFDTDLLRRKLEAFLPYYMIPSVYMKLDRFPHNIHGKIDKASLPLPDFTSHAPAENIADETERELAAAFSKVLGLEHIGIDEDFFELGGDSEAALSVSSLLSLPDFDASFIYEGRTARGTAAVFRRELTQDTGRPAAEEGAFPLLPIQHRYVLRSQKYPDDCGSNIPLLLRFDAGTIDALRLCEALRTVSAHHEALSTIFFTDERGVLMQRLAPELLPMTDIEVLTEEELEEVRRTFVRPFHLTGELLWRARLIRCRASLYLFTDFHHAIADGRAVELFFRNLKKAYYGEKLPEDSYFRLLSKHLSETGRAVSQADAPPAPLFCETGAPLTQTSRGRGHYQWVKLPFTLSKWDLAAIKDLYGLSEHALYIAAASLALMQLHEEDQLRWQWGFHGRTDKELDSTFGLFLRLIPIHADLRTRPLLKDFFHDLTEQISSGIRGCHSLYAMQRQDELCTPHIVNQGALYLPGKAVFLPCERLALRRPAFAPPDASALYTWETGEGTFLELIFNDRDLDPEHARKLAVSIVRILYAIAESTDQPPMTAEELLRKH